MISGGNATVFVSNFDRAVHFYTQVLGLKITNRFGDRWATVEAGPGLTIGIHPVHPAYPAPGTKGAITLSLEIDEPIEITVDCLSRQGVQFSPIVRDANVGNFADCTDPDGNPICLCEFTYANKGKEDLAELSG